MAERWWTFPAQADNGNTIMVSGRDNIDKFRESGKYISRIDVTWQYNAMPDGMPEPEDAALMGAATEALEKALKNDKCAVLTGIYTGDGKREWVLYCKNLKAFSFLFNKALDDLDQMPLVIEALPDAEWEEYAEMRNLTYIPRDESER